MKYITLFFIIFGLKSFANMASPYGQGTLGASAFSSRDVDIIHEQLIVTPDKNLKTALYNIEYTIQTDIDGMQIPLLFYAMQYEKAFEVWVDGIPVKIQNIPQQYTSADGSPFSAFDGTFSKHTQTDTAHIFWNNGVSVYYPFSDLKYFETTLKTGLHKIKVNYIANTWSDKHNWVKEYSFRYALAPARYWRSFGTLDVVLNMKGIDKTITTNLGTPHNGNLNSVASWQFKKLPEDDFIIYYTPPITQLASIMVAIGPFYIALVFTLCLAACHAVLIRAYRKRKPLKKYSIVVISGSLLIPLIFFILYLTLFDFIDNLIGDEASRYHGYVFLIIVLYPVVMPLYWLLMAVIDSVIKKRVKPI